MVGFSRLEAEHDKVKRMRVLLSLETLDVTVVLTIIPPPPHHEELLRCMYIVKKIFNKESRIFIRQFIVTDIILIILVDYY